MYDTFVIFFDKRILVVLTDLKDSPTPMPNDVLDWYAANYAFERSKLTGCYAPSVSVAGMKYKDFMASTKQENSHDG